MWTGEHLRKKREVVQRYDVSFTAREAEFWRACEAGHRASRRRRRLVAILALLAVAALVAQGVLLTVRTLQAKRYVEENGRRNSAVALALQAERAIDSEPVAAVAYLHGSLAAHDTRLGMDAARRFLDTWTAYDGMHNHRHAVSALVFSPAGDYLASMTAHGEIGLWPLPGGEPRFVTTFCGPLALRFDARGEWLYWADGDGDIWRWPVAGGDRERVDDSSLWPDSDPSDAFSDAVVDSKWRVVKDKHQLRLVPSTGDDIVLPWPGARAVRWAIDPAGRFVAGGSRDGRVRLWHLPTASAAEMRDRLRAVSGSIESPRPLSSPVTLTTRHGWAALEFVYVPAGRVITTDRILASDGFWMPATEVTQAQYLAVMGDSSVEYPDRRFPIANISWDGASEFAFRFGVMTGVPDMRLPSDREWEYAARAGSPDSYPWGDDSSRACLYGNVRDLLWRYPGADDSARIADCHDGAGPVSQVARYTANGFGLHDMIGNVSEMTVPHKYLTGAAPSGPRSPSFLYVEPKGGNFTSSTGEFLLRIKWTLASRTTNSLVGFRVIWPGAGGSTVNGRRTSMNEDATAGCAASSRHMSSDRAKRAGVGHHAGLSLAESESLDHLPHHRLVRRVRHNTCG